MLDKQLGVGPFQLNLADLGLTNDIQDKLDDIPRIIQAIVAMYIIGAIFVLLCLFGSFGAIAVIPNSDARMIVMGNAGLAGGAVFFLLIGNLITTIGSGVVVDKVTDLGDDIGLSAVRGGKFMALSWGAFVLMLLTVSYWSYEFFAEKKRSHDRAIGGGQVLRGFPGKPEGSMSETNSTITPQDSWRSDQTQQEIPPAQYQMDSNEYNGTREGDVSPMHEVDLRDGRPGRESLLSPQQGGFNLNRQYQN